MFKFTLPKWVALPVITPEGATCPMVHMGDGVFLSAMPPISLHTCQPLGTAPDKALVPAAWDSGVFGPDVEMAQSFFDAPGAAEALAVVLDGLDEVVPAGGGGVVLETFDGAPQGVEQAAHGGLDVFGANGVETGQAGGFEQRRGGLGGGHLGRR